MVPMPKDKKTTFLLLPLSHHTQEPLKDLEKCKSEICDHLSKNMSLFVSGCKKGWVEQSEAEESAQKVLPPIF